MVGFALKGQTGVYVSEHKVFAWGKHLDGHLKGKYCTVLNLLQSWIMCMRIEVND